MKLTVKRFEYGTDYTIGRLYIDDEYFCFTLEDKVREVKILGKTAIPTGEYKVVIDFSNRFQRKMPHILNVPNYEGVRIHTGNTSADTEGCILVGGSWAGNNFIGGSRPIFNKLFAKMEEAEEITIKVE